MTKEDQENVQPNADQSGKAIIEPLLK